LIGGLSVFGALLANLGVYLVVTVVTGIRVVRRYGIGKPDARLARQSLWYGFRVHSNSAGGQVTTRLDLFIMPALIGATSIGQYAVAINVSTIVASIASFLPVIVLPAAARAGPGGARIVVACTFAVLGISVVAALAIGLSAGVGVRLIYGDGFADSVLPLRLLLGGTVALAAAQVLAAGIAAANRPFTAGMTQLPAVSITIVGLALFLKSGGIVAAAIISTVAYLAYFVTALILYKNITRMSWRMLMPSGAELQQVRARVHQYAPWRKRPAA
jgi:O-antigen/teichoic acid export membrane protein